MPSRMTIADACAELGVSRKTLYRMIAAGALPKPKRIRHFRKVYLDRTDFEKAVRRELR